MTESIRAHLYTCAMVPSEVRRRAKTARESTQALIKRSQQLIGNADVLVRETEATFALLREIMRQSLKLGDVPSP